MVSITGCFLSVCVMPALVFLKNMDLPSLQQTTMGGVATFGAVSSTAALHFVFGAYVLEMRRIRIPVGDEDDDNNPHRLEATTRSVLGFWKNTYVFDPCRDITPYKGAKPFANFCANGVPLYVHPERLDPVLHALLLQQQLPPPEGQESASNNNNNEPNEGIPVTKKKKKKDDDDDDFF